MYTMSTERGRYAEASKEDAEGQRGRTSGRIEDSH